MNNQHNFQSDTFRELMESITRNIPALMFFGIIVTYMVTAALNVYFIPLPSYLAITAALLIQFGRFAVVFMDFLNPTGHRSKWPPVIATVATVVALVELGFSIQDMAEANTWSQARYWSVYLFGAMLIGFGYILEINFIQKAVEAYGMKTYKRNVSVEVTPQSRPAVTRNTTPALVTAEKKPEIMRELRERQEAQQAPQQAPAQQVEEPKTVVHTAFGDLEDEIKSMSPQERAVLLSVMIQRQRSTIRTNKQRIADKEKKGVSDTSTQVAAIQNAEAKINYYQSFL